LSQRLTIVVCRACREGAKSRPEGGEGREKMQKEKGEGGREGPSSSLPIPLLFRLLILSRLPRWLSFARFGVKRRKRFNTASDLKSRADFSETYGMNVERRGALFNH